MKRINFFVLFAVLLSVSITVEAEDKGKIGGIRAGWHYSGMYNDGNIVTDTDPLNSFYVGFFKDKNIIPVLDFGSGLEYFQNGVKYDEDNKWVLHQLSVPLNLKANIGPVFALTGFSPTFKVSEKIFINGEKSNPASDEKSEWFDIPFHVGAGVKILFITIEARYHWGLLEVNNGYYSRYLQLGAGISF